MDIRAYTYREIETIFRIIGMLIVIHHNMITFLQFDFHSLCILEIGR